MYEAFENLPAERRFPTSGGLRDAPVDKTLQRLLGILGASGAEGFHYVNPFGQKWCHMVYAKNALPPKLAENQQLEEFRWSYGKGTSRTEAIVSALAEGIERRSAIFRGNEFDVVAAAKDLASGDFLLPNAIDGFGELQLKMGATRPKLGPTYLPEPFQESAPIQWTKLHSLNRRREVLVPTQSLYFFPKRVHSFCLANSNGLSAGNSLFECLVQGFLELVERDAQAIWWYNNLQRPCVDVGAAASSHLRNAAANFAEIDRGIWFLNLTHDLGIPVIAAVSEGHDGDFLVTAGAHFDPETAALRALTEMAQRLDRYERHLKMGLPNGAVIPRRGALLALAGETVPIAEVQAVKVAPEGWFEFICACANQLQTDLLFCDMTRPEFGFPVAKVLLPGFAFHRPRFGVRRLRDVPIEMGWLKHAKSEAEFLAVPWL